MTRKFLLIGFAVGLLFYTLAALFDAMTPVTVMP